MTKLPQSLSQSPLGKKQAYISTYSPDLLFPIPRAGKRDEIGIGVTLPFKGVDIWTAFELSWLNLKGKPCVAITEFYIPCESVNIIESKSLKLYLNSFNQTPFESIETVKQALVKGLSNATCSTVKVVMYPLNAFENSIITTLDGKCLDSLDIECNTYQTCPDYLSSDPSCEISEILYSDLLKSNCLVTGQPDWGSIQIAYSGPKIDPIGLLKYIVSFRNHNEFHEQCVERIFVDLLSRCHCKKLTVYARYTRRGGLDINPIRSTHALQAIKNNRLARQ